MNDNFKFRADDNTKIARYMSLEKFLDLLNEGFKFIRCDQFEDFYENKIFDYIIENEVKKETSNISKSRLVNIKLQEHRNEYLSYYVLCFNSLNCESNLMWNSYTDNPKYGICITSTVSKLNTFFKEFSYKTITPYNCYYTDYTCEDIENIYNIIPTSGSRDARLECVFKLNAYSGEHEIRFLIINELESKYNSTDAILRPLEDHNTQKLLEVIDSIVISPYASTQFVEFITYLLKSKYNFDPNKIRKSELKIKPNH